MKGVRSQAVEEACPVWTKEAGSSDLDVQSFCCKKFRIFWNFGFFEIMVYPHGQERRDWGSAGILQTRESAFRNFVRSLRLLWTVFYRNYFTHIAKMFSL